MRQIFRSPEDQRRFDEQGYIFGDFLGPDAIARLREVYFATAGSHRSPYAWASELTYYMSVLDQDPQRRRAANQAIRESFQDAIDRLLLDYRAILCNYMIKDPKGGEIPCHQDTTLVDEERYVACNLFVPLEDTGLHNGCFHMVPGTHRLFESTYRHNSIPDTLVAYNEAVKPFMVPQPLPAGRGILFDHKMFHYSPDNHADVPRVAVQLLLVPSEAQVVIAHYDPSKDAENIRLLAIPDDYLTERGLFDANFAEADELPVVAVRPYQKLPEESALVELLRQRGV